MPLRVSPISGVCIPDTFDSDFEIEKDVYKILVVGNVLINISPSNVFFTMLLSARFS